MSISSKKAMDVKEKSICPNCIHHNLCIAENNQPCFECNRFIDAKGAIKNAPTADVAPKVELEAMRSAANCYKLHYEEAVADIKTLLGEMEFLLERIYRVCGAEIQIHGKYAELKKKYTEEE